MRLLSMLAYPFTLGGRATRGTFVGVAVCAVLGKWGIDSLIYGFYDRPIPGLLHYLVSPPWTNLKVPRHFTFTGSFFWELLSALFFFWLGLCMTHKRLRTVQWAEGWIALYLLPITNVLLFLFLLAPPDASPSTENRNDLPLEGKDDPSGPLPWYSQSVFPVLIPTLVAFALATLGIKVLPAYSAPLFIGIPFGIGLGSSSLIRKPGSSSYTLGYLSLLLFSALLLLLSWEGIVCLVMAAPLAILGTAMGIWVGNHLRAERGLKPTHSLLALGLSMPLALVDSAQMPRQPLLHRVTSELHVAAPPEVVWNHVVSFSDLPPPGNWIFRYGLAYPMRARIEGEGVGAMRHCEFSTGAFVEPITVWDAPRHLAFAVTQSPSPMRETNPFGEVAAPHLDGYFASRKGEFRLTPTSDGGTLLQGTTWYEHGLKPEWYWSLWGDAIIHRIHGEVLSHVARLSTSEKQTPPVK